MEPFNQLLQKLWRFYADQPLQLLASLALASSLAVLVLVGEWALIGWERSSLRRLLALSNSARTDLLAFILVETSLAIFVGMAMLFGLTYFFQKLVGTLLADAGKLTFTNQALALAVFFLIVDFFNYWIHRLCHSIPALWEIHRYHHSAPEMTVLTSMRDHPMERAFSAAVFAMPAALLAMPVGNFVLFHGLAKMVGFVKHSNIQSNWGWFGRYIIQSPAAHWVHHSANPAHYNKNFSSLFQFWDVIFGTAMYPTSIVAQQVKLGVVGDTGNAAPLQYLWQVWLAGWSRAIKVGRQACG